MNHDEVITIIKELMAKMGVLCTAVTAREVYNVVTYAIETPDAGALIGKDGMHLNAFNFLVNQILSQKTGTRAKVNIDVNEYREKAINDLRIMVRKKAEEVTKNKEPISLPPMSPYERMIVHSMFADDLQVETESSGEGRERHITIKYRTI